MRGLCLVLLLLPFLAGCMGGGAPPSRDTLEQVRLGFQRIDELAGDEAVKAELKSLKVELVDIAGSQDFNQQAEAVKVRLLIGYCWERLGGVADARREYGAVVSPAGGGCRPVPGREYGAFALFRIAQISEHLTEYYAEESEDPDLSSEERQQAAELLKEERKHAIKALERATNFPVGAQVLVRTPETGSERPTAWETKSIRSEAHRRLDKYYRDTRTYQVFEYLVRICGGTDRSYSYVLSLVVLAVLAKVVTTPLSLAQFKSMRAMQAIQPELKKLQEKFKGDKQQMARAQMALFKEHKINPASSCLPMLIQLPILMWVYWGIRRFTFRFLGVPFLYLESLGEPDVIRIGEVTWPGPLLIIYGLSMYFSQKLISTPATTPEQQQQQKLMAIILPVMLVIMFKSLPAAFIFYWLLMNILMTGHQYLIMRPQRAAAAAASAPPQPAPPPPEAIQKLSQGGKARKKKKKRR